MKMVGKIRYLVLGILAVAVCVTASPAKAEFVGYDYKGLHAGMGLSAGLGTFNTHKTNFGAGSFAADDLGDDGVGWWEMYIMPNINVSYDTGRFGTLYSEFAYVGAQTLGGGDPIGFSNDSPGHWESERLYVGWKSGTLIAGLPENVIDVSFGEQEFAIGDGFLIADGEFDGAKGAYWLAPHKSFRETAILKVNTQPVRGDLFYLKSDDDYADTALWGVNLEYIKEGFGTIGTSWMTVTGADDNNYYENRKGMDIWSIRGQGTPFAAMDLEELFLAFEYADQSGGDRADVDAYGFYGEAGWTFSNLPWTPTLSYRYAQFSGDDLSTDDYEGFDPMFYGFLRGWGTHFMGEITGEYYLFNTNQKTHMVHLNALPTEKLSVGAIYYNFKLADKDDAVWTGTKVDSKDFADEINVYADYALNDNVWLSAVVAAAFPNDAAEEMIGDDKDMLLFEAYVTFTF